MMRFIEKNHHISKDIEIGDLKTRLFEYSSYKVKFLEIRLLNADEFEVDRNIVEKNMEEIHAKKNYPPIVVSRLGQDYTVIDGIHRLNALKELRYDKVWAYVGENE